MTNQSRGMKPVLTPTSATTCLLLSNRNVTYYVSTHLHWAVFFSSLSSFCSYKDAFVKQFRVIYQGPSSLMKKPNQKWNGNACMSRPSRFFFCRVFCNIKFEHCSRNSLRFLLLAGIFVPYTSLLFATIWTQSRIITQEFSSLRWPASSPARPLCVLCSVAFSPSIPGLVWGNNRAVTGE